MILNEFDPRKDAIINPANVRPPQEGFPRVAVSCFSHVTFDRLVESLHGEEIARISNANLPFPIYRAVYRGVPLALYMSPVGAPSCVGALEEMFSLGAEKIVLFGNCGVLDASIADCSIIIPDAALRDEGTSYHYAPPSDEIAVNPRYREEFIQILRRHGCSYTVGKVWTTDAFYRETHEKVARRRESGCICVEMECAAVAAVAAFRGKDVFHFFYAADNLASEQWDERSLSTHAKVDEKDRIAQLALELAEVMARS